LLFRKPETIQRLNLEDSKPGRPAPSVGTTATSPVPLPNVNPKRIEAVKHRAKDILDSGRIAEWLFVCQVPNGLLLLRAPGDHGPVMLLFSSPFAAGDYLRATRASLERLKEFGPEFAGPLDFSPELPATAMVGLTMKFGIVPDSTGAK
jgi:hypothetical protein